MRFAVLRGAIGDGVRAREWYALGERDRSRDFDEELQRAFDRVARFPRSGTQYLAGTRRVLLRKFPYFVVYRLSGNTCVVVAIAHFSQETGFWIARPR